MLVVTAKALVAPATYKDCPHLIGRVFFYSDGHRPHRMQFTATLVRAVEADQSCRDSESLIDHLSSGSLALVNSLVKGVPPGSPKVVDSFVRIELKFQTVIFRSQTRFVRWSKLEVIVAVEGCKMRPGNEACVGACRPVKMSIVIGLHPHRADAAAEIAIVMCGCLRCAIIVGLSSAIITTGIGKLAGF